MKKTVCALICLCLMLPVCAAPALADNATVAPSTQPPAASGTLAPGIDDEIQNAPPLMRIAGMSNMLQALAHQAYFAGSGWNSVSEIADMWDAAYYYINMYELSEPQKWETTAQGFTRVPSEYIKQLFSELYGQEFTALPQVSRAYSSCIVYDSQSDVYDVSSQDCDALTIDTASVVFDESGTVAVTYRFSVENASDDDVAVGSTVTIYLEPDAAYTSGFRPLKVEYTAAG